jgi:chromosomal replication initiator protein
LTRSSRTSRPFGIEPLSAYRTVELGTIYEDRHEFGLAAARNQDEPQHKPPQGEEEHRRLRTSTGSVDAGSIDRPTPADLPSSTTFDPAVPPAYQPGASSYTGAKRLEHQRDPQQVWQMVREDLADHLARESFERFVEPAWVLAYEDGEFIIAVPSAMAADYLDGWLRQYLKRALGRYLGRHSIDIVFRVQPKPANDDAQIAELPLFGGVVDLSESDDLREHRSGEWDTHQPEEENSMSNRPHVSAREFDQIEFSNADSASAGRYANRLLPEYTFDTFVVGDHNRMAHAAATAIAEEPGRTYNPLFIYGGVGLGKTHLLHAIGNSARRRTRQVLYRSSEQFTNELIESIGRHSTDAFRARYRRVDVLLIDDIQFIGNKERTQEEFFHTFNHLYEAGSQIVLTSDRPPKALATLEKRLRSRFEGGLQTDIAPPDMETRVAILERKAMRLGMTVDKRVLMAVAERFDSNIRELEGALNQLNWQSQLARVQLTYETAVAIVDNLAPQRRPASPPDVIRVVANHFDVLPEALIGPSRKQPIAHFRQIVMYLLREENGLSLQQVGDELGGRDHSTIRYGADRIVAKIQEDDALRLEIGKLREKIYTPLL